MFQCYVYSTVASDKERQYTEYRVLRDNMEGEEGEFAGERRRREPFFLPPHKTDMEDKRGGGGERKNCCHRKTCRLDYYCTCSSLCIVKKGWADQLVQNMKLLSCFIWSLQSWEAMTWLLQYSLKIILLSMNFFFVFAHGSYSLVSLPNTLIDFLLNCFSISFLIEVPLIIL